MLSDIKGQKCFISMYGTVWPCKNVTFYQTNATCGPFGDPDLNSAVYTNTHTANTSTIFETEKFEHGLDFGY